MYVPVQVLSSDDDFLPNPYRLLVLELIPPLALSRCQQQLHLLIMLI